MKFFMYQLFFNRNKVFFENSRKRIPLHFNQQLIDSTSLNPIDPTLFFTALSNDFYERYIHLNKIIKNQTYKRYLDYL
jgi:hypothetical protein